MVSFKQQFCFKPESELSGQPYRQKRLEEMTGPGGYARTEWGRIIRDSEGAIIFARRPGTLLAAKVSEALGKPLFAVHFFDKAGVVADDQIAFGVPDGISLDDEERAAIGIMAWLDCRYHHGIKRHDESILPDALDDYAESRDEYTGMPTYFFNEHIANAMASVIGRVYRAEPRIIRNGGQWGVVIKSGRAIDSQTMAELAGIHRLLEHYTITPKTTASPRLGSPDRKDYVEFDFARQMAIMVKAEDDRDAKLSDILALLKAQANQSGGGKPKPRNKRKAAS